jgi:hypothetical protein
VKGLGNQFLSGSALARDQDGGSTVRDLFDFGVDLLHRSASSDEVMEGVALGDLGAKLFDFSFELLGIKGPINDDAEFDVERFL